jgi:hypothetical protein
VTPETRPAPAGEPAATLEGDLRHFFATEVLQFLQLTGATGRLEFERGGERAEVVFEHGRPALARTTGRSVRIGDVLVHRGAVPMETLEKALAEQRGRPDERLGAILLETGAASGEEIARAVGEVFRRIVCVLSLWPDGRFRFVPEEPRVAADVPLEVELDRLILEGLHRADLVHGGA